MANENEHNFRAIKDWVLKSGYPLENDVELVLQRVASLLRPKGIECDLRRDFTFPVITASGDAEKIRSVDFLLTLSLPFHNIVHEAWPQARAERLNFHILVDCKWSQDALWFFVKSTTGNKAFERFPYLLPALRESREGQSIARGFNAAIVSLAQFPGGIVTAKSGRKFSQKEESGQASLASYQWQLADALVAAFGDHYQKLGKTIYSDDSMDYYRDSHIFVPIVVSKSKLFMMFEGITSPLLEAAKTLKNVGREEPAVIVSFPDLVEPLSRLLTMRANITGWLSQRPKFRWEIDGDLFPATLFTALEHLENTIWKLLDPLKTHFPKTS